MNKRSSKWLHPTRKRDQRLTTQVTVKASACSTAVFGSLKCCIVAVQGMPCRLSECETLDFSLSKNSQPVEQAQGWIFPTFCLYLFPYLCNFPYFFPYPYRGQTVSLTTSSWHDSRLTVTTWDSTRYTCYLRPWAMRRNMTFVKVISYTLAHTYTGPVGCLKQMVTQYRK